MSDNSSSGSSEQGACSCIRPVVLADGESVYRLIGQAFDMVMPDLDAWLKYWKWKTWDNPFRADRSVGFAGEHAGEIVGYLGGVHIPLRIMGKHCIGVIPTEFSVSARADGSARGVLALQLAEAFCEEARQAGVYVISTTSNEKTAAIFGRFDCMPVEWTKELWRAPVTLRQQIRSTWGGGHRLMRGVLNSPVGGGVLQVIAGIYRVSGGRPSVRLPRGHVLCEEGPELLERDVVELHTHLEGASEASDQHTPFDVGVDRSSEYLKWRYLDHPDVEDVGVFVIRDRGQRLVAAEVVQVHARTDDRVAYVEELLFPSSRSDLAKRLLCAALNWAADRGAAYLFTAPGRVAYRSMYWELGFESRGRSAPAVVAQKTPPRQIGLDIDLAEVLSDQLELWHGGMF
jgi:hypothetical protein